MLYIESLRSCDVKSVKSFISRTGRGICFKNNEYKLWSTYGLSLHNKLDQKKIFGRITKLTVEIGFGNGKSLLELATQFPDQDFIGIEVYNIGIKQLLNNIKQRQINNIRIYYANSIDVFSNCISDLSLQAVNIFFPDPWQKNKHHKRRLIQPYFIDLIVKKMLLEGIIHIVTDWQDYAKYILEIMNANIKLKKIDKNRFDNLRNTRIITKFEQKGLSMGHKIWDLIFCKKSMSI